MHWFMCSYFKMKSVFNIHLVKTFYLHSFIFLYFTADVFSRSLLSLFLNPSARVRSFATRSFLIFTATIRSLDFCSIPRIHYHITVLVTFLQIKFCKASFVYLLCLLYSFTALRVCARALVCLPIYYYALNK